MRSFRNILILLSISFSSSLISCSNKAMDGMVIFTRASELTIGENGDLLKYDSQSQIVAINPEKPDSPVKILTEEFYSAVSHEVSFDGKHLLFSARQEQNDPWQVWEMNLEDLKTTQITSSQESCIDPSYLPLGQIVFSRYSLNDSLKAGRTLFTCNLDGTNLRRITFNPHEYYATSVMKDGRVITTSRQLYPDKGDSKVMVLRPDGTKSELFYESQEGKEIQSRGWETSDGKIVFIEAGKSGNKKMDVITISYNRPLHSLINLTSGIKGNFYSAYPLQSGKLLVSYKSEKSRLSLCEFDPDNMTLGKSLFESADYDALGAVLVREHERPKKLPSEVDMGVKTGQLLCQNLNVTDLDALGTKMSFEKADRIEIVGIDSSLGVVKVENDGSFYLKVVADMPFTLKTMDANGKVINGPGNWIWLRPNERRGCVGCHEDHEMVPANILPLAVKSQPVSVPVHVSVLKEKEVELE